jgi:cell division septum initiation protein DivIVA
MQQLAYHWSYRAVVEDESSQREEREKHPPAAREGKRGFAHLRQYLPRDMLDVSFPVSVRGYDRRAVDAYVKRANRVIAEVKVSASPSARSGMRSIRPGQGGGSAAGSAGGGCGDHGERAARGRGEHRARAKAEAAQLIVSTSAEADRMRAEADEIVAGARAEAEATLACGCR